MTRRIMLNGFKSGTIGHTAIGLWTHPDNRVREYRRLDYWTDIARTLERGKFDALFIADTQGIIDVYQGSTDVTLREAIGIPIIDPMLLVSAMAGATEHLGFAITASTTYEKPFDLARKFATLDLVTGGRVGWNVVTSSSRSEAENFSAVMVPHDERYRIADEFMDVAYQLWEGSWEDDAVVHDRASRVFIDPSKVHRIEHHGTYFDVPGEFIVEPTPQRTPTLYQAGSSRAGVEFAAKHAEGVFVSFPRMDMVAATVARLRDAAEVAGRPRDALKVFPLSTVVTGATDEEAQAKYDRWHRQYASPEGNLARFSALVHVDMASLDPDMPLEYVENDGIQGSLSVFTRADPTRRWTPREIGDFLSVSSMGALFVGSPTTIADQFEQWVDEAGVDGFNISDTVSGVSFPEFVDLVVPELQRRGLVWNNYEGATFREHLYGVGHARTMPDHPATRYRHA
ncbi:LLM class flavin-dependent oxidoreductase [Nakamurella leprariae]|uniref:LLM class flavin-dependent oxidoreductase n=1 Tax=Nakamurella leprariae TaxID=2803911 RepID=A0A938Y614_9ACTN|nr:LLM class flavin-dependent oxidoreductase [Nakamurella leprariae]MBM9466696.1 LLM class flavin-dependent oxidoreductase [Nakamurella leprariae]